MSLVLQSGNANEFAVRALHSLNTPGSNPSSLSFSMDPHNALLSGRYQMQAAVHSAVLCLSNITLLLPPLMPTECFLTVTSCWNISGDSQLWLNLSSSPPPSSSCVYLFYIPTAVSPQSSLPSPSPIPLYSHPPIHFLSVSIQKKNRSPMDIN